MRWLKKEIDKQWVRQVSQIAGVSPLEASVLYRRGLRKPYDLIVYLDPSLAFIPSAFLFGHMQRVVQAIRSIPQGSPIFIVGDTDVDGVSATVLLSSFLRKRGYHTIARIPRHEEPYGLTNALIQEAQEQHVPLIFTVDCGIKDTESVRYANTVGIEVIILDHHLPEGELPPALAIVNPQVAQDTYPNPFLCASEVVSQVIWALCFVNTPFYEKNISFLYLEQNHNTYNLYLIKFCNGKVVDKWIHTGEVTSKVVLTKESNQAHKRTKLKSRLVDFLQESYVVTHGISTQRQRIRHCFGLDLDVQFFADMALNEQGFLGKYSFPAWLKRGKALFQIDTSFSPEQAVEQTLFFYFVHWFFSVYVQYFQEWIEGLDLVMLGTLADIMPLREENRIFVAQGLALLKAQKRQSLKDLLQLISFDYRLLSATKLTWTLIPILNSCGRMNIPELLFNYLTAQESDKEYRQYQQTMLETDAKRRELSQAGLKLVKRQIAAQEDTQTASFLVVYEPSLPSGITGLIAAKLLHHYRRPALVLTQISDQNQELVGSIRTPAGVSTSLFLEIGQQMLISYGGHHCAAGLSIKRENLDLWKQKLQEVELPAIQDTEPLQEVDAHIPASLFSLEELWAIVQRFQPFGKEHERLVFTISPVSIATYQVVGRGGNSQPLHIKLQLQVHQKMVKALFFQGADFFQALQQEDPLWQDKTYELVFYPDISYYRHQSDVFLNILALKAQPAASKM